MEPDEEGEHQGLREKAFKYWKTGFLSAKLQNFALLHINNRYKYNNQRCKYKKDTDNLAVSNICTFCKFIGPDTIQVESREHLYLNCYSSVKVLKETADAMGIEINDLDSKGYETLIYKKQDNVWEEKIYSYYSTDSISLNAELGKDYHVQTCSRWNYA